MTTAPETTAALHGRRAGLQTKLRDALISGNSTSKIREDIAAIDRLLAEREHADAVAVENIQRAAAEQIEAAAQATAAAIHERRTAVMADFAIPEEIPLIRDPSIDDAAADLSRCDAELADATAILTTAQAHDGQITGRIKTLEAERQAIVGRRAEGDQRPTDGGKLAELAADIEGLTFMTTEASVALAEARRAVTERNAACQRAVTSLSRAESAALAAARRDRLDELAPIMLEILMQDRADRKRTGETIDWVAPPALLDELTLRKGQRPDLATGGQPGSRFPASAAYRPALRSA